MVKLLADPRASKRHEFVSGGSGLGCGSWKRPPNKFSTRLRGPDAARVVRDRRRGPAQFRDPR